MEMAQQLWKGPNGPEKGPTTLKNSMPQKDITAPKGTIHPKNFNFTILLKSAYNH